jgi:hypothetical protein
MSDGTIHVKSVEIHTPVHKPRHEGYKGDLICSICGEHIYRGDVHLLLPDGSRYHINCIPTLLVWPKDNNSGGHQSTLEEFA